MRSEVLEPGQALGRTIKVLRTDHGLSRKDLAREVDISYSYLTEIENGNKPPSNTRWGLRELEALVSRLSPDDLERVLDLARRLAR